MGWLWILLIVVLVVIIAWWGYRSSKQANTPPADAQPGEHSGVHDSHERDASVEPVPDDLVIIEGIGPKTAEVLKAAGISTFAQLARTDPTQLEEILKSANLRLADPGTWPEQARLAAAKDMEGLKAYQEQLKGGRTTAAY